MKPLHEVALHKEAVRKPLHEGTHEFASTPQHRWHALWRVLRGNNFMEAKPRGNGTWKTVIIRRIASHCRDVSHLEINSTPKGDFPGYTPAAFKIPRRLISILLHCL